MRKALSMIFAVMLMLLLAACGQTAEPVQKETDEAKVEEDLTESDLTLEEVFKKTEEANKDLKSFKSKMNMKQTMEMDGETQEISSDIDMEFVNEPMELHQKMLMSIGGEQQEIEAYLTKDGFYMYEPNEEMWIKLPEEFSGQILQMSEGQTNPSDQLDQLKEFVDDFDFKQDDKNYILTLKASGEKFDQFLKDQVKEKMPAEMQVDELMNDMKFNIIEYELFIDKETFYMNALNMVTDMDTEIEGQVMNMKMDLESTYSNFNEIQSIEIPKEALENAQEINMDEMAGE